MRHTTEKLALMFVLGALLLDYPVLAIFNRAETMTGMPVL